MSSLISILTLQSMFPSQWKTVQVHCIHKNGSTQDWKLQSNFTYKYTKQVIRKYYCFFWTNKLVTTPQWGFRKGRSFELLLLSMTEKWRFVLDERESIGIGNLYWLPKGVWFCLLKFCLKKSKPQVYVVTRWTGLLITWKTSTSLCLLMEQFLWQWD